MATNQIKISKKPHMGARNFIPLDTKIMRTVPIETSATLAKKISSGIMIQLNISESKNAVMSISTSLFNIL
jgi:hypothetical protein